MAKNQVPDNIEFSFLDNYQSLEVALLSLGFLSKSAMKKWISKKLLKKEIKAQKSYALPINLINSGFIYPEYQADENPHLIDNHSSFRSFHKPSLCHSIGQNYNETNNLSSWMRENNFHTKDKLNFNTLNRLDFETSGIIIQELEEGLILTKKIYLAVVEKGKAFEGEMLDHLTTSGIKGALVKVDETGSKCRAHSYLIDSNEEYDILAIDLETGFKHQIRFQLASRGCPIIGDEKYGGLKSNRLMLHALAYQVNDTWTVDKELGLMSGLFDFDSTFKMVSNKTGIL